jgi:hypothetical protein
MGVSSSRLASGSVRFARTMHGVPPEPKERGFWIVLRYTGLQSGNLLGAAKQDAVLAGLRRGLVSHGIAGLGTRRLTPAPSCSSG